MWHQPFVSNWRPTSSNPILTQRTPWETGTRPLLIKIAPKNKQIAQVRFHFWARILVPFWAPNVFFSTWASLTYYATTCPWHSPLPAYAASSAWTASLSGSKNGARNWRREASSNSCLLCSSFHLESRLAEFKHTSAIISGDPYYYLQIQWYKARNLKAALWANTSVCSWHWQLHSKPSKLCFPCPNGWQLTGQAGAFHVGRDLCPGSNGVSLSWQTYHFDRHRLCAHKPVWSWRIGAHDTKLCGAGHRCGATFHSG